MDLFKLFIYFFFLIQRIQNLLPNQLNDENTYEIEINDENTNKIILQNEDKVNLRISSSLSLNLTEEEGKCEIEEQIWECKSIETTNDIHLIFIQNDTNKTFNLYINFIKYEFKNIYCFSDKSQTGDIFLYPNKLSENDILVSINDRSIQYKTKILNNLTYSFDFNKDSIPTKLKVSYKNNSSIGDETNNIVLNYYFSSIPKISHIYYPAYTSFMIYLSFNDNVPSSIEKYNIIIDKNYKIEKDNDNTYIKIESLTNGTYEVIFVNPCDEKETINTISVIDILNIDINITDIEVKEKKSIKITFNQDFYKDNLKVNLANTIYNIVNNVFEVDGNLAHGIYDIGILVDHLSFKTNKQLTVHVEEICNIINDIIAIENAQTITFDLNCINITRIEKEENSQHNIITCPNNKCSIDVDKSPKVIKFNVTTWKSTIIPLHIILYSFNKNCSASLEKPITFTITHDEALDGKKFQLQVSNNENIEKTLSENSRSEFTFSKVVNLKNLQINYNNSANIIPIDTSGFILTDLKLTSFSPKFLSNHSNQIQKIVINYNSEVSLSKSIFTLRLSGKNDIKNEQVYCTKNQCESEFTLNGNEANTYDLYITDHCGIEKKVNQINLLSNIAIDEIIYRKTDNSEIIISTTEKTFFKEDGTYSILIANSTGIIQINDNQLIFPTPKVELSPHNVFIKFKSQYNFEYEFKTNSILYLYENDVNIDIPLNYLYVDQKYEGYEVSFVNKILTWQIKNTELVYENQIINGVVNESTLYFPIKLKFIIVSKMDINIYLVNNSNMTYNVNIIKNFSFVYANNFSPSNNKSILLNFEKYDIDDDLFMQKEGEIFHNLTCITINYTTINCMIEYYKNDTIEICYQYENNCKSSQHYSYDISNNKSCIEESTNIIISLSEGFSIILQSVTNTYNFNYSSSKYELSTDEIESDIYQIYINSNTDQKSESFPIEMPFEIYQSITSNDDEIYVNINKNIIEFNLNIHQYIILKKELKIKLKKNYEVESKFCYLKTDSATCIFDLTSLPYDTYEVLYNEFCGQNFKKINNLKVIISEDIVITHPIIEIQDSWIIPDAEEKSIQVKYGKYSPEKFNIIRIVLVNTEKEEQNFSITNKKENEYVSLTIHGINENISEIYFIKTVYRENDKNFTEISDFPHYLVISPKPTFNINRKYFLKTTISQELRVEVENIKFSDKINIYIKQQNNMNKKDFKNYTITIDENEDSKDLEGNYTIGYQLCRNCLQLNDENEKNIIIIHENQEKFFEKVKINDCLYRYDLYYVIKIDFNDQPSRDEIEILLGDNILEGDSDNYYRIKNGINISKINELIIREKNEQNFFIFKSIINVTTFDIKDEFFYASKGVGLTGFECILKEYNLSIKKDNEEKNLTFINNENDIIYYGFKDFDYIYGECTLNNSKTIFSSNDLKNSYFNLIYSDLNNTGDNIFTIVNNRNDFYFKNIISVTYHKKFFNYSISLKVSIDKDNNTLFNITKLQRDDVFIVDTINSINDSSNNIQNNIIGFPFYISQQFFIFDRNQSQEYKSISFYFKTEEDVTEDITISEQFGEIFECSKKGEQMNCLISLKLDPNIINVTIKGYTDNIYEYVYSFIQGTHCQTIDNKQATKNISIAVERPKNINHTIHINYGSVSLQNKQNDIFILKPNEINTSINKFDVIIENVFVNSLMNKLVFHDKINIIPPNNTIEIVMNTIDNNITFEFISTLNISKYTYFLYKQNDFSYEKINAKILSSNDTSIYFQFDLYSLKEEQKKKIKSDVVDFGYRDDCGDEIFLDNIKIINEDELDFFIERHYLSLEFNVAKVYVKGTKNDTIQMELIRENDIESHILMKKISPGIFIYDFNEDSEEGKYYLRYKYNEKEENIKQYIVYKNKTTDLIEISFDNSTNQCLILNNTENIIIKLDADEMVNISNISIYLIDSDNNKTLFSYDEENQLFELGKGKFKELKIGEYNITINEISMKEEEMMRYEYFLTNVSYSPYYYYNSVIINMECEPNQFDFFSSTDNTKFICNYTYNDTYKNESGYICIPEENFSYGNYTIKIFNKFKYYTFISKYLNNLTKGDFFFDNNKSESEFILTAKNYYLPLIKNFTILKENEVDGTYQKGDFISYTDYIFFTIKNYTKTSNYYLETIYDDINKLNVSLNLTKSKYLFYTLKSNYYINNTNENNATLNIDIYFKVKDNFTTPDDITNLIFYTSNGTNKTDIEYDCEETEEKGKVNCILNIKNNNPFQLTIEYDSDSKTANSTKVITINQYDLKYYNCDENKRINLIIYFASQPPKLYDNDKLIQYDKKEDNKLTYFNFIDKNSEFIIIKDDNDNDEEEIPIYNVSSYKNKLFTYENQSIEIGRISQEIKLLFNNNERIEQYEIPGHKIFFNSIDQNISITDFDITNKSINFSFNVPNNYNTTSNEYTFSYTNICNRTIHSNNFNLTYPEYRLMNVRNTLISPRDEEELFLNFSTQFKFKNISVNIGDNNILLNTNNCTPLNNEIVCKFNMTDFKYEYNKTYKLLDYEIDSQKKYNWSEEIEIINETNTSCQIGIIVSENGKCILPDDIEQKADILKQYNFCNKGKGYCMKDNENNYYCSCKNNYEGIYCEYTPDEEQKNKKVKQILESLENNGNNISNESLVLIKEIIDAINKTIIKKENMDSLLKNTLSNFVNNTIEYYSNEKSQKHYFIYPFDLAFYIISLNKENDTMIMINKISYVVNNLVTSLVYKTKNIINTGVLSNFKYSCYNSNEKDNYLPRFEYENNINSINSDFDVIKLVIPYTIKNKNNESDIIFLSVKTNETENLTNIKFYFSSESVINKDNLNKYFKYKKYNHDIFKPDDPFYQSCFIQNNESLFVDFPPIFIKNNISLSKKINTNNKNCKYNEINNKGEIIIKCNSIIEKDLYVLLEDSVINNTNFSKFHLNCLDFSINLSTLYNNKMSFYSIIIILIYIIFIILIKIIDPIITGIKNDKLDESQHKIPEQTELSSIINDEDFDEEENVKVRQTRATFIELKKKESYFSIVLKNIIELHPLISSFRPNILAGMIYKFTMLLFNFFLLCSFNVFFYNENLLMKRATIWEKGNDVQSFLYPLINEFLKIIISSLLSIPFIFLMNLMILTNYDTKNRLADAISGTTIELERKDLAKDFKKKIFIRKLIGFIFMILVSITSICYCIIFCFKYPRTQSCFLYSVIWSLIINWIILSPIHIFLVSHYQNNGNESKVYYMKRLNLFN